MCEIAFDILDSPMLVLLADHGGTIRNDHWAARLAGARGDTEQVLALAVHTRLNLSEGIVGAASNARPYTAIALINRGHHRDPVGLATLACAVAILAKDKPTLARLVMKTDPDPSRCVTPNPDRYRPTTLRQHNNAVLRTANDILTAARL